MALLTFQTPLSVIISYLILLNEETGTKMFFLKPFVKAKKRQMGSNFTKKGSRGKQL